MKNKITIIGVILTPLIIIGLMLWIVNLKADIDVLEADKVILERKVAEYVLLEEKRIEQIQKKSLERNILIEELKQTEEYVVELIGFTEQFDSALITRYAPLDPNAIEGMCYSGDPNITSTGMQVGPNIIAVDPARIPYGSKVLIEGFDEVFIAGDTGSAMRNAEGLLIDVFAYTKEEAFQFGIQERKIIILE